jgi:UDP-N-acetylmuramyl tripeptide synthase
VSRRTLRTSLAIGAGRATGWLSRVTGRGQGATISGRVMNAIAPDLLRELAADQHVALVSATNGKTTTTRLLAAAVAADGRAVVSNSTGANLTSGIAPTLARADGPGTAVLEVDERVVERVVEPLGVQLCVFGNLSRDQLDRYGEVHAVGDAWRRVAEAHPDLAVVANASDPHVVWAASPAKVTWVELGLSWRQDATVCPSCGALLEWSAQRFDCHGCGFAQPEAPHRLDGDAVELDGRRIPLALQLPGAWNRANAALALVAAVTHFGLDPKFAADAMSTVESVAGRFMRVALGDGRDVTVILSKNPAGWSEALRLVADRPGAGVVIAVNARVADGKDPSWLWDVPYEWLAGHPVAASGERRLDVAVRLHYADLQPSVDDDPLDAARALSGDELYVIASYTQFSALYRKHGRPERVDA